MTEVVNVHVNTEKRMKIGTGRNRVQLLLNLETILDCFACGHMLNVICEDKTIVYDNQMLTLYSNCDNALCIQDAVIQKCQDSMTYVDGRARIYF